MRCTISFGDPVRLIVNRSREQSQPALGFPSDGVADGATFNFNDSTSEFGKFSFDCAFYRRTKREMLANGWDETQIFGRQEIDVDTILLGFMDPHDSQSVPTWSSRTVNKLLPAAPIPLRLASAYLLTKMMRVSTLVFRVLALLLTLSVAYMA